MTSIKTKSRNKFYLSLLIFIATVHGSCSKTKQTHAPSPMAQSKPVQPIVEGTEPAQPFSVASSFCLNSTKPIITWISAPPVIEFKLYNRWGAEIIVINDPNFTPAKAFPVVPAGMNEPGTYLYVLSYTNRLGQPESYNGYLNYMGKECK
jgi:hypothetical protein